MRTTLEAAEQVRGPGWHRVDESVEDFGEPGVAQAAVLGEGGQAFLAVQADVAVARRRVPPCQALFGLDVAVRQQRGKQDDSARREQAAQEACRGDRPRSELAADAEGG